MVYQKTKLSSDVSDSHCNTNSSYDTFTSMVTTFAQMCKLPIIYDCTGLPASYHYSSVKSSLAPTPQPGSPRHSGGCQVLAPEQHARTTRTPNVTSSLSMTSKTHSITLVPFCIFAVQKTILTWLLNKLYGINNC